MPRIWNPLPILLAILLAGALACDNAPVKIKPYTFETADGQTIDAELGRVRVPENRRSADSRTLDLRFVRFPSTSEHPGSPIVYLAGGPGGSGIGTARGTRFPLFMALREFGDVIALDQRGTGMTGFEELDCDDRYAIPLDRPLRRSDAQIIAETTRGCVERLRDSGVDVSAYNTRESAADLNDLRLALGADKLTLWGISYGTHLALATLKYHEDIVDKVILAGIEGLGHSIKLPSDQQALMQTIAELTAQDPTIGEAVPDLLGSIDDLLQRLERNPVSVTLTDPSSGSPFEVTFGKFDLQVALSNLLRGPETFAFMPDVVARMERGDWIPLALAASRTRMGEGLHGMTVAMDCASGSSTAWRQRIQREAQDTLLGDAINFPFPEVCEGLGIDDLGAAFRAPVSSAVPALLISGTLDGRTPVSNAEALLHDLENAQHLIIDGAGHSDPLFLSSPRILEAMRSFLRSGGIPEERIALPPVTFAPHRRIVALTDADLKRYVGSYEIGNDDVRRVIQAGDLLFTKRGTGPALPIRPISATEFIYEGSPTRLIFEQDGDGGVTGMLMYHDGEGEGEPARKID